MARDTLYNIYEKLQSVIAPGLKYSQAIYEDVLTEHCPGSNKWLDMGCGHQLFPAWRFEQEEALINRAEMVVGLDFDFWSLTKHETIKNTLRGDITELPFPDNTFDIITSNMVFEHLDKPEKQLEEISRVLSKGGKLIFHTTNVYGYSTILARIIPEFIKGKLVYLLEGRKEEDLFPTHYRINSSRTIRRMANATGFSVLDVRMICSSAEFAVVAPVAVFELCWIRFLLSKMGRPMRTNIIAVLEKT